MTNGDEILCASILTRASRHSHFLSRTFLVTPSGKQCSTALRIRLSNEHLVSKRSTLSADSSTLPNLAYLTRIPIGRHARNLYADRPVCVSAAIFAVGLARSNQVWQEC